MAKYQYRILGRLSGVSSVGNAVFALANKTGSGKRITIRSFEMLPLEGAGGGALPTFARLSRCPVEGGFPLNVAAMDSEAGPLPDGLEVNYGSAAAYASGTTLQRVFNARNPRPSVSLMWFGVLQHSQAMGGPFKGAPMRSARRGSGQSSLQRVVINPGEAIALYSGDGNESRSEATMTFNVSVVFRVRGTPDRTYLASGTVAIAAIGDVLFSIRNNSSSVVDLMEFGFEFRGSENTAFYSVCKYSSIAVENIGDPLKQIKAVPLDSSYPAAETWVDVVSDTPVLPLGVPAEYVAQGSLMLAKGFSYLHTNDFVGPTLRTLFPECGQAPNYQLVLQPSLNMSFSPKSADLMMQGAEVVVREGEAIGVTVAAETVQSVPTAITVPLYMTSWYYSIAFDVENASQPYLTINDMVAGTDIVVLEAGTSNVVHQIDAYSGTSWSWAYDQDALPSADVALYKPGYVPRTFRNVPLGSSGASIIASQQADRNYLE